MEQCYCCKNSSKQLLMLSCHHDACIKCAANNYCLNTQVANILSKKDKQNCLSPEKLKKSDYFCEICLEITKIDQETIKVLKQWYIANVNRKYSNYHKEHLLNDPSRPTSKDHSRHNSRKSRPLEPHSSKREKRPIHCSPEDFSKHSSKQQDCKSFNCHAKDLGYLPNQYYGWKYAKDDVSKQRPTSKDSSRRAFGSIVKRGQLRTDAGLKGTISRAKDEQRQKITSFRSQQKQRKSDFYSRDYCFSKDDQREVGKVKGKYGFQSIDNTKLDKRKVYLDVLGYEHSLDDEARHTSSHSSFSKHQPQFNIAAKSYPKSYCRVHNEELNIYYCIQCQILICAECGLYGNHNKHNFHTVKKAALLLKQSLGLLVDQITAYLLIQEQTFSRVSEEIKSIKLLCFKQRQRVKHAFQNFIKNVQNKYGEVIGQLQDHQDKALLGFNEFSQKCRRKCHEYKQNKAGANLLLEGFGNLEAKSPLPFAFHSNHTLASTTQQFQDKNYQKSYQKNLGFKSFDNLDDRKTGYLNNFDCFQFSQQFPNLGFNIQEIQSKLSSFQSYITKLRPQYQKTIYPLVSKLNKSRESPNISSLAKSQSNKEHFLLNSYHLKQSELHESLKFSEVSLLNQRSSSQVYLSPPDFIEQNLVKSINLIIEKQPISELKQNIKLGNVDIILEAVRDVQDILMQCQVEYKIYDEPKIA